MAAKEVGNLMTWLKEQGFDDDKIVECIETIVEKDTVADDTIVDKEKLDIKRELAHIKERISELKFEVMRSEARLKVKYEMIFEEIAKVCDILDKNKEDNTVHMA